MTRTFIRIIVLSILCAPAIALASSPTAAASAPPERRPSLTAPGAGTFGHEGQEAGANVNTRYEVERVWVSGVAESAVSQALRDDMQRLVGKKYDPEAAQELAERLREELTGHRVTVKVRRGDQPERVQVVFETQRFRRGRFEVKFSPLLYTSHDEFSGALVPDFESHHNYVSFGYVTNANDLLERNTGWVVRYEHRKVGTSAVQVGVEYGYFHPSFEGETESALVGAPLVPGIYRTREMFAPSFSLLPSPDLKVTFGASLQTLEMQYPAPYEQAARALTLGVQYRKELRPRRGLRHTVSADYALRDASRRLQSDFLYTRHWAAGSYAIGVGRHHEFGFHFQGGRASGTLPLFERFSIGNATTLRGWDKFDVAPLGGTRLLYGSLAYRYRPFELFYDFGTAWDEALGQSADWKHSVGIGLAWRNGFFVSIGVPVRDGDVRPAFLFGIRR